MSTTNASVVTATSHHSHHSSHTSEATTGTGSDRDSGTLTGSGKGSGGAGFLSSLFSTPSKRIKDALRRKRDKDPLRSRQNSLDSHDTFDSRDGQAGREGREADRPSALMLPLSLPFSATASASLAGLLRPSSNADLRGSIESMGSGSQSQGPSWPYVDRGGDRDGDAGDDGPPEPKPELCLRINVRSVARYRLCDSNPQDEADATWAVVTGVFQQSVLLRGHEYGDEDSGAGAGAEAGAGAGIGSGGSEEERRLVVSDRVVTVDMNGD